MVTPLCFDLARDFSEGRAAVMVGKKWGFIGRDGVVVIEPQYDSAWSFSEGIAPVIRGSRRARLCYRLGLRASEP
jgi:hypothetical protein